MKCENKSKHKRVLPDKVMLRSSIEFIGWLNL